MPGPAPAPADLARTLSRERALTVLLDYDGTLVPIAQAPELAAPDAAVHALLAAVAARSGTSVHLVTGRPREIVERWFGNLLVDLWAEHGFWHRARPDGAWHPAATVPAGWVDRVHPILEQFTASTPGSFIEKKSASVAWHYRIADDDLGARHAHDLRLRLGGALSNQPFEILDGKKVVEVRLRGVSKALVSERIVAAVGPGGILAIGDDTTDEDMFGALPPSSVTIVVGTGSSCARYRLQDYRAVRRLLGALCQPSDTPFRANEDAGS